MIVSELNRSSKSLPLSRLVLLGATAGLAAATSWWLLPSSLLADAQARVAALCLAAIFCWATGVLSESLTALTFFALAMLMQVAPPEIVFSGFASSAFWLIFSGLILGAAINRSGLGERIASVLAARFTGGFASAIAAVAALGLALAFVMPSAMGRVAMIVPILSRLVEQLGYGGSARGRSALMQAGVLGTILPATSILPANVPNNVLVGVLEKTNVMKLGYADYLIMHFPVLGAGKWLMIVGVILAVYRNVPHGEKAERSRLPPMRPQERGMAALLACALAFWATDSLHHISPAWIGLAAAVICLTPSFGLLPARALQAINLEPAFYVAGIVSLGALLAYSGVGRHLAAWATELAPLSAGSAARAFFMMSGVTMVVGLLTTLPGAPVVMTPLAVRLSDLSGLSLQAVVATQVVGFSTLLLPFQAPPLAMALQIGDIPRREAALVSASIGILSILLLWPLDFWWLRLLGTL